MPFVPFWNRKRGNGLAGNHPGKYFPQSPRITFSILPAKIM